MPFVMPSPEVARAKREAEFLTHVVKGEQRQAEEMLKKNRHLALASGTVTDHADRTFNNITGFQYAVWALDWHMWSMIQKYLPEEAAQSQAQGFTTGPWVEQHGVQANWQNLLDAYKYYLDNYSKLFKASKWTELNNIWLIQIGGAQKLLPMHVFHEYCHPDRPFDPVPDFTGPLPRSLPDWFSLDKIGSDYSIYRTAALRPKMWRGAMHKPVVKAIYHYTCDRNALTQLASTRSQQREQLVAELTPGSESRPVSGGDANELELSILFGGLDLGYDEEEERGAGDARAEGAQGEEEHEIVDPRELRREAVRDLLQLCRDGERGYRVEHQADDDTWLIRGPQRTEGQVRVNLAEEQIQFFYRDGYYDLPDARAYLPLFGGEVAPALAGGGP